MNQQQAITNFKAQGYSVALCNKNYSIMTRPLADNHVGQVVFKDGEIQTLRTVDAIRAFNNEEINMSSYTRNQILAMPEKERTDAYNKATGKTVARMRNADKAADEILAAQKTAAPEKAVSSSTIKPPKDGTVSDTVWIIAAAMTKTKSTRSQIIDECVSQGINVATARTQYQRWSKYNNPS